jgi:deoxyribonuclease-4
MAKRIGANTFQYFTRNPRGGAARRITEEEVEEWKVLRRELDLFPVVGHLPYTVNLAAPKEQTWDFARRVLLEDMRRAAIFGAEFLVVHPGSHLGEGVEAGIERISRAISGVLDELAGEASPLLLLETMAGQGSEVGFTPGQIGKIISLLGNDERLGVCLDTCHLFAAGYDMASPEGIDRTLADFEGAVGLGRIKAVHLNDSRMEFGSRKDRHALLGRGHLGDKGLAVVLNHPFMRKLPFLLETPVRDYIEYGREIALARKLAGEGRGMGNG